MSRTPLFAALRRVFRLSKLLATKKTNTPCIESLLALEQSRLKRQQNHLPSTNNIYVSAQNAVYSRRRFLTNTLTLAAGLGVGGLLTQCGTTSGNLSQTQTRIAIIGGGMAGLSAAYHLKQAGIHATIYEATKRAGGRMFSLKDKLGTGLVTELGGEFIDSSHEDLLSFAKVLQLQLLDIAQNTEQAKLIPNAYYINGQHYSETELITEFSRVVPRIQSHAELLPNTIDHQNKDGKVRAFDLVSLEEYWQKLGINGWLLEVLNGAYTGEYGLEVGEQSSLNFLTMIDTDTSKGRLEMFGDSDERFKIVGGNAQIPEKLAQTLNKQMEYEYALEAISAKGAGYSLAFSNGKEVYADIVIMTLPFSIARQIKWNIDMPTIKHRAIQQLGYGTNSKLVLGMNERTWRKQGYTGMLFNRPIHTGWDSSQGQNNDTGTGTYTVFAGGSEGREMNKERVSYYKPILEQAFKGFAQQNNDRLELFNWAKYPNALGSYSCYKTGQWTGFGGVEALPVGNILFAGEHTSTVSPGFMNGAAESGRVAATNLLRRLSGII